MASIDVVEDLTATVKLLELKVHDFEFIPGQWVDLYVPSVSDRPGGFSICSPPALLPRLQLAIKASDHPLAVWAHNDAAVGDEVFIAAGGDVHHTVELGGERAKLEGGARHLILVAGGVGINPILSIALDWSRHCADMPLGDGDSVRSPGLSGNGRDGTSGRPFDPEVGPVRTTVIYSDSSQSEFPFLDSLKHAESLGHISLITTCTTKDPEEAKAWGGRTGRVDEALVKEVISEGPGGPEDVLAFVCGPPKMPEEIADMLVAAGVPASAVRYETWW